MTKVLDEELTTVMVDLAPYLCVSRIKDYPTEIGRGAPVVRALLVAPSVSTGSLMEAEPYQSAADIPVVQDIHWLWREGEQWVIDYPKKRQCFQSRDEAVAYLQATIRMFWQQRRGSAASEKNVNLHKRAQQGAPADRPAAPRPAGG